MPRVPRSLLVLQIMCGVIIGVGIELSWLDSEAPLWELRSPDGPYYVPGWRTALVFLLLMGATQWLSLAIFRKIEQTIRLRDLVRRHQVFTALAVVLAMALIGSSWIHTAALRGQLIARIDLANGHIRLLGFGEPPPWRSEFARLLSERYGIEFRAVAACIVSKPLRDYVDGYDQVSMGAARRKWGRDVFKECSTQAQKITSAGRAVD